MTNKIVINNIILDFNNNSSVTFKLYYYFTGNGDLFTSMDMYNLATKNKIMKMG